MRYNLATLAELRVFDAAAVHASSSTGSGVRLDAMLVAVGNGPSYGGGLRMCEGALLDDGLLDVVIIKPISKPELLRVYPRLFRGTHVKPSGVRAPPGQPGQRGRTGHRGVCRR